MKTNRKDPKAKPFSAVLRALAPLRALDSALNVGETVYRQASARQRWKYSREIERIEGCKIISVGNLTVGGTGKTPAVQWIARVLQAEGARVAVVARGYGGAKSREGAVVSNGEKILLGAQDAGDEPMLHARALPGVPVLIGRDRVAACRAARQKFGAQVIVLDDGFQFYSLFRDFDLLLLDARRPFDNGHLLPRGRLREAPAESRRAHAILLTRSSLASQTQLDSARAAIQKLTDAPVFEAQHAPLCLRDEATGARHTLEGLHDAPIGALSAIADNQAFAQTLRFCGARVVSQKMARDHHRWRQAEVQEAARRARRAGAARLVTTEKDAVKLQAQWTEGLPLASLLIEMRLEAAQDAALRALILSQIEWKAST